LVKKDEAEDSSKEHRVGRKGLKKWQTLGYLRDSKKRLERTANSWTVPKLSYDIVDSV